MKPREFWIRENEGYEEIGGPRYFCSSCAPRPPAESIHVREVLPDEYLENVLKNETEKFQKETLVTSELYQKLDRTQRALEKAKEALDNYKDINKHYGQNTAMKALKEIEAIERGDDETK